MQILVALLSTAVNSALFVYIAYTVVFGTGEVGDYSLFSGALGSIAGYITTLMTYCAITGKSAVGQTYDFAETTWRSFSEFKNKYYTYNGATTNYPEIFKSESDMKGLQTLIDQYLEEKAYREYQFK